MKTRRLSAAVAAKKTESQNTNKGGELCTDSEDKENKEEQKVTHKDMPKTIKEKEPLGNTNETKVKQEDQTTPSEEEIKKREAEEEGKATSSGSGEERKREESEEPTSTNMIPQSMIDEHKKITAQILQEDKRTQSKVWKTLDTEEKKAEIRKKVHKLLEKSANFTQTLRKGINIQPAVEKEVEVVSKQQDTKKQKKAGKAGRKGRRTSGRHSQVEEKVEEEEGGEGEGEPTDNEDEMRLPLYFTGGTLRTYQHEGLLWLKSMHTNGLSGILADEMGLGKTVQAIALICHLYEYGSCIADDDLSGPILVIAPLSTLMNWISEFERFAPKIPVVLYHGTKDERRVLIQKIAQKFDIDGEKHYPVILTSYEIIIRDRPDLQRWYYPYLLIDEGHRIKNMNCRLVRELKTMTRSGKGDSWMTQTRLLMTGTPLQNNISELWSLLHFLMPNLFDNFEWFEEYFDFSEIEGLEADRRLLQKEEEQQVISKLHAILHPILLRRLKTDVILDLPPKKEILVYAPLTERQKEMYQITAKISIERLDKDALERKKDAKEIENLPPKRKRSKVDYACLDGDDDDDEDFEKYVRIDPQDTPFSELLKKTCGRDLSFDGQLKGLKHCLMFFRKITMHPYLVELLKDEEGYYIPEDDSLVSTSGKMMVLDQLLTPLKEQGHKVLLFSQMTHMMDILGHYCNMKGYEYCRLDGNTKLDERMERMKKFNEDENMFIFLLSTRAGGLGVNLTAADTVIFYDSDWNPQMDLQAQDRCHRIGQTKPVIVYRLVARGTIDEQMIKRATNKRRLEKMIIHKKMYKFARREENQYLLSPQELVDLLRSTDFSKSLDAGKGDVISQEDLHNLLDRSIAPAPQEEEKKEDTFTGAFQVINTASNTGDILV